MSEIRIFRGLVDAACSFGPCALTIGNFDGVHAGHRAILARVNEVARRRGIKPSVLSFYPHPARVLKPGTAPPLMTSHLQKCALMGSSGIEQVMLLRFTPSLALLDPEEFVRRIIVESLKAEVVMVGENFRFGRGQTGDCSVLGLLSRKYGFSFEAIPFQYCRKSVISSSRIRAAISAGDVSLAARQLGRFYSLTGRVVRGHGVGSTHTVPTLNLRPGVRVLPKVGVYVTQTASLSDQRIWPSITNVGYRPTFNGEELTIETYLLGPIAGLNPSRISVAFLRRLRDERRFETAEELKSQILLDVGRAQIYHRRLARWAPARGLASSPILQANGNREIPGWRAIPAPDLEHVKLKLAAC
jgi:riboflavin kinase / FMN adenylyltransferase